MIIGCAQPHSLAPLLVKLNLFIVNIEGTSLTYLNSSGSGKYLDSGFGISFSKKSRFHKVFKSLSRKLDRSLTDFSKFKPSL